MPSALRYLEASVHSPCMPCCHLVIRSRNQDRAALLCVSGSERPSRLLHRPLVATPGDLVRGNEGSVLWVEDLIVDRSVI